MKETRPTVTDLIYDARLSESARIIGLHVAIEASGDEPTEIPYDDFARILKEAPSVDTIARHVRQLVVHGYIERRSGGRGSPRFAWAPCSTPQKCGANKVLDDSTPQICGPECSLYSAHMRTITLLRTGADHTASLLRTGADHTAPTTTSSKPPPPPPDSMPEIRALVERRERMHETEVMVLNIVIDAERDAADVLRGQITARDTLITGLEAEIVLANDQIALLEELRHDGLSNLEAAGLGLGGYVIATEALGASTLEGLIVGGTTFLVTQGGSKLIDWIF